MKHNKKYCFTKRFENVKYNCIMRKEKYFALAKSYIMTYHKSWDRYLVLSRNFPANQVKYNNLMCH